MKELGRKLIVQPGSKFKLGDVDPADTHGLTKARGGAPSPEEPGAARRPAVPALCRGTTLAAGGAAGHRCGRQGRHHPPCDERPQSAGRHGHAVQSAGGRGEAARLFMARSRCGSRVGQARDLQPFALRGRAGGPGARSGAEIGTGRSATATSTNSSGCSPTTASASSNSCSTSARRNRPSGFRSGWTIPPRTGSSPWADIKEREFWDQYIKAYDDALRECSTDYAPWFVIPANHKWFRNLAVSQIMVDTLEDMKLEFPKPTVDPKEIHFE